MHDMKYNTMRYIYMRLIADTMASLIKCMAQKRNIRKTKNKN